MQFKAVKEKKTQNIAKESKMKNLQINKKTPANRYQKLPANLNQDKPKISIL